MEKRKEYLSKHKWAISKGKDGYWRTYLPDKEHGRRMIKKLSKEEVENIVIKYWEGESENPTIREVFNEWNDRRLEFNSKSIFWFQGDNKGISEKSKKAETH